MVLDELIISLLFGGDDGVGLNSVWGYRLHVLNIRRARINAPTRSGIRKQRFIDYFNERM
jgi:hypothetical protein